MFALQYGVNFTGCLSGVVRGDVPNNVRRGALRNQRPVGGHTVLGERTMHGGAPGPEELTGHTFVDFSIGPNPSARRLPLALPSKQVKMDHLL